MEVGATGARRLQLHLSLTLASKTGGEDLAQRTQPQSTSTLGSLMGSHLLLTHWPTGAEGRKKHETAQWGEEQKWGERGGRKRRGTDTTALPRGSKMRSFLSGRGA
jgi:hypothetical protein